MSKLYKRLIAALADRSVNTYFQSKDQLVISTQAGPAFPFAGNSFWVARKRRRWYLCTWGPVSYEVPSSVDFVSLCDEFVHHGRCAQTMVPDDLVKKYQLRQLDCDESDQLFSESKGPRYPE